MIRRPPRSTLRRSSAASDVYKRTAKEVLAELRGMLGEEASRLVEGAMQDYLMALIHSCEPTRLGISYADLCLKKKKYAEKWGWYNTIQLCLIHCRQVRT